MNTVIPDYRSDEDVEGILADVKAIKAHNETLEKAAQVCDRFALCYSEDSLPCMVARGIGEEIQALKVKL